MTLVLTEANDGAVHIGVQATEDARPPSETPVHRMAVYLLAAASKPPYPHCDLPALSGIELQRLSAGRLVRFAIR